MPTLTDKQLHDLARLGAIARLKELEEEAAALRKMFPGLKKSQEAAPESPEPAAKSKARKRKKMSPEARKAVGERITAYWAKKRGKQVAPEAAPEVGEKAEGKAPATTTPAGQAKNKKKASKKTKKASSSNKMKGAKRRA